MLRDERTIYPDIYFEPEYARLYETRESKAVEYRFECEYGTITNLFLKRKINTLIGDGIQYYDISTPYGYGGPIVKASKNMDKLIATYMDNFHAYTEREHIVSEFVRFHPIIGNALDFKESYSVIYDRKTVGTNLTYADVIGTEFSKHKRKDIRRILKNSDINYRVDEDPESLEDFVRIYYSTMDRDGADDFYYFKPGYFEDLLKKFRNHIITGKVYLRDKLIAMGIYFCYGKYLHAHLSGTLSEYLYYSPACILKYALALYGHEKGYEVIHYGGGTSSSEENNLYKFKREFGKNTQFDFYIAKKIWNEDVYEQICRSIGADTNTGFFPAYRAKSKA